MGDWIFLRFGFFDTHIGRYTVAHLFPFPVALTTALFPSKLVQGSHPVLIVFFSTFLYIF